MKLSEYLSHGANPSATAPDIGAAIAKDAKTAATIGLTRRGYSAAISAQQTIALHTVLQRPNPL